MTVVERKKVPHRADYASFGGLAKTMRLVLQLTAVLIKQVLGLVL
jgi:hypothetical protein